MSVNLWLALLTTSIVEERLEIAELVKANGAEYEGDLTKSITHLISFRTEGAKYKAAKQWGLQIVSIEWFRDCLERGMMLEEKFYDPVLPERERGAGAWDKSKPKRTSLGKRLREGSDAGPEAGKRKLRRTASSKLSSQHERIWGDIVGGGGNTTLQVARSGQWGTDEKQETPQQPTPNVSDAPSTSVQIIEEIVPKTGMFARCRFYLHNFPPKKTEVLSTHLLSNDGEIAPSVEDLVALPRRNAPIRLFRIVPHDLPTSEYPVLPISSLSIETVTLWWVERCLHNKKFMDPSEHVIGRPFPVFPIPGFETMTIASSAFTGIDLLHFMKAVPLIGAVYDEEMTQKSSVLVTKSLNALRKDKYDFAQEWNVPIVTAEWFWDSITAGIKLPMGPKYRCRSQKRSESIPVAKPISKSSSRPERSKSDIAKQATTAARSKLSQVLNLDKSAIETELPTIKNEEVDSQALPSPEATSPDSAQDEEPTYKPEPLSEMDPNLSPARTVSTAPAPSDHPYSRPQDEDISSAITSLLAKTKTVAIQPSHIEPSKRSGNRILGRVTSNLSTGSAATSVDSTATHGNCVEYPPHHPKHLAGKTANEHIELLMNGDRRDEEEQDSCPPATQLQYDDPDSTEAKEMLRARMMGQKREKRKGLEKAITLGDGVGKARNTRRAGKK